MYPLINIVLKWFLFLHASPANIYWMFTAWQTVFLVLSLHIKKLKQREVVGVPKVTQLISERAVIQTEAVWFQCLCICVNLFVERKLNKKFLNFTFNRKASNWLPSSCTIYLFLALCNSSSYSTSLPLFHLVKFWNLV